MAAKNPVGRPPIYTEKAVARICVNGANKLQEQSLRRAVVNVLVENRGAMTIGQLNEHFDFDVTNAVMELVKVGWLAVDPE